MQAQRKTLFLLPGIFLFLGFTILLFRMPDQYPLVGLLFFVFVLTTAIAMSAETGSVFGALVTAINLALLAIVPGPDKACVVGEIILLWIALSLAKRIRARDLADEKICADVLQERHKAALALHKEKDSMEKRLVELDGQAQLRQHLFNAVHELSSLLDPVIVRQRLMEFVQSTIGRGTIHYFAGNAPRDAMDKWVMDRRLSLLVTDVAQDSRFRPARSNNEVRSVLAAPIVVERQLVGIVRLNGFEPDLFAIGDLRILEVLSLLASLALENLQLLAKLEESATKDNLTGLYTHRFFQERLADEILRAGRYHTEFCLLLMDIDHFKRYNDTYGHAAGDAVLVRFAAVLKRHMRSVDLLARYGGEEFVMILPQTVMDDARQMAESIRMAIESELFQFGSEAAAQERVTVTIGVSGFPHEATVASQLVRVADYRLYQGKEAGRNRVIG